MPPIVVFRFSPTEGPARFAEWLDGRGLAWELVALDAGAAVPADPARYAGVGMMGGPMSVNDALPWIAPLEAFVRAAIAEDVPVIGHCLGGQLLAHALGAPVTRAAVPEIGWHDVTAADAGLADAWLGGRTRCTVFQWHNEAFALPRGAVPLLANRYNPNQAYVIGERHLGLQCHVEMTRALVEAWCDGGADELPPRSDGAVQSRADILRDVDARLAELAAVSDTLYTRWARGLRVAA